MPGCMNAVFLPLQKAAGWVVWANRILVAFILGALFLVMFSNVILRYVFLSPFSWSDEISKILMIWMGFMGACVALWEKQHVGIDVVVNRIPSRFLPLVHVAGHFLVLYFLIFMLWFGIVHTRIAGPVQVIPILRLPMTYTFAAVPLAAGLMILYQFTLILEDLQKVWGLFSSPRKAGSERI